MKIEPKSVAGALLLSGFLLVILSDEVETRRVSSINECLGQYFHKKGRSGNRAAQPMLDACKTQHGLNNRFKWDNPALHLLSFPACKYRNGWSSYCLSAER